MITIRVIVVEDQPVARERLVSLLAEEPDIRVVAACAHGGEAVERIRALAPDLVFLDVQMPELDGLGVVRAIGVERMPAVVFVTAFDEYAVRAFEVHALDYLLKPFGHARLRAVLQRVRQSLTLRRESETARRLLGLLRDAAAIAPDPSTRITVRTGGRVMFVSPDDLLFVEASGNYALLHTTTGVHKVRDTVSEIEARLRSRFTRIHRSTLVNLLRVRELRLGEGGEYDVLLDDGRRLRVTRQYRASLEERLRTLA
jgi:two-component system LytT family response regulator